MTEQGKSVMGGQSHTPWTTNGDHDWSECSVSFDHGGTYYTVYEPGRLLPVAFSIGDDEGQARLIAAAPESLAALRLLVEMFDDYQASDLNHQSAHAAFVGWQAKYDAWDGARAAVARATERSQ